MSEQPGRSPTALVTGATGFLGGYLAAALRKRGYRVRALARETSDVRRLEELGIEIVRGDLFDPASLARAFAGERLVFHSAGKVTDWAPREEFERVNVGGTRSVVAACQDAGVERLVHVGSLTVLGLPRDGKRVDEETPYASKGLDPYTETKIAGERLVRAAHGRHGLATTVVRPGVIWGPGDVTIIPRFVDLLRRGRMVYVNGGANVLGLSHVDNLSLGLMLAAEAACAAGQVYHVTDGEEITAREALDELARVMGTPRARLSLPFPAVFGAAALMESAARLLGRETPPAITRYGARLAACHCRYDLSKARRELGYEPTVTFRQGITALAAAPGEFVWSRPHGLA